MSEAVPPAGMVPSDKAQAREAAGPSAGGGAGAVGTALGREPARRAALGHTSVSTSRVPFGALCFKRGMTRAGASCLFKS